MDSRKLSCSSEPKRCPPTQSGWFLLFTVLDRHHNALNDYWIVKIHLLHQNYRIQIKAANARTIGHDIIQVDQATTYRLWEPMTRCQDTMLLPTDCFCDLHDLTPMQELLKI